MAQPQGSHIYIGLYRGNMEKKLLSETIRLRALIFDICLDLVDLYQVCSSYTPGAKIGPTSRVTGTFLPICKLLKKTSGKRFRAIWPSCLRVFILHNQIN